MTNDEFLKLGKKLVVDCNNSTPHQKNITEDDVFIVWSCKTLQNNKALLGTHANNFYFEVTHNGDKEETYLDVYKKTANYVVKDEEVREF